MDPARSGHRPGEYRRRVAVQARFVREDSARQRAACVSRHATPHPPAWPALSRAGGERRAAAQPRMEGYRAGASRICGGYSARRFQPRPLDAALSHRGASLGRDDDALHGGITGALMYALTLLLALTAQRPDSFAAGVREYITVDTSVLALTHVLLVDGTGTAPRADQTIVIRAGKIAAVGAATSVQVPADARTMDMSGSTVIPGLIGMHDHLFYTAAGGRAVQMSFTGPRLYLGSGVTTIRTTGGRAPYAEINLKDIINRGVVPGPRIHLTAPYVTGTAGAGATAIGNSPRPATPREDDWRST